MSRNLARVLISIGLSLGLTNCIVVQRGLTPVAGGWIAPQAYRSYGGLGNTTFAPPGGGAINIVPIQGPVIGGQPVTTVTGLQTTPYQAVMAGCEQNAATCVGFDRLSALRVSRGVWGH